MAFTVRTDFKLAPAKRFVSTARVSIQKLLVSTGARAASDPYHPPTNAVLPTSKNRRSNSSAVLCLLGIQLPIYQGVAVSRQSVGPGRQLGVPFRLGCGDSIWNWRARALRHDGAATSKNLQVGGAARGRVGFFWRAWHVFSTRWVGVYAGVNVRVFYPGLLCYDPGLVGRKATEMAAGPGIVGLQSGGGRGSRSR